MARYINVTSTNTKTTETTSMKELETLVVACWLFLKPGVYYTLLNLSLASPGDLFLDSQLKTHVYK